MTDPVKRSEELKRYHIGEQTSETTIQPQGEPIESPNGWWYPADEAGDVIRELVAELTSLRGVVEKVRKYVSEEVDQPVQHDLWQAGKKAVSFDILSLLPKVT